MSITLNKNLITSLLTILISSFLIIPSFAQNCGCDPSLCCSKYGYCGSGDAFCGTGCQSGPCDTPSSAPTGSSGVTVSDVVTQAFFDGVLSQGTANPCPGKTFYTRDAFLNAISGYPDFGTSGTSDDSKREIAAFFANAAHETGRFCSTEENNGAATNADYCDPSNAQYPCVAGKKYYGRGPLQLTGNGNYGAAGQALNFDGLNNPEILATDVNTSFKSALWFWMTNVHSVINQGFGATIRAINGAVECNGGNTAEVNDRVQLYQQYCTDFGVDPGQNLSC